MKRLMCLALVVALMAPVAAYAQSSPPSTGSDEISRDLSGTLVLPQIRPRPMPFVGEVDRALLGIEDPEEAAAGLATVTRTRDGETVVTPASEQLRDLFFEHLANPGPTSEVEGSSLLPFADDRVQIADSSALPERAVGWLWVRHSEDHWSTCTGALVGPRAVVTAAHCLYDHAGGGWPAEVVFYPGALGREDLPHGGYDWQRADLLEGFVENYDGSYGSVVGWDLAVVSLAQPAGEALGWLPLEPDDGASFRAILLGYPEDKPEGTLWGEECEIPDEPRYQAYVLHDCPSHGVGGGPLLEVDDDETHIRAINVAEGEAASYAIRLNGAYHAWLTAAID